ncbi:TPA: arginine--tRNA ligase [Candidatus Dependentiae bacterium]|nr:MAG: Arginine-tRNA ligase [candidate division TM6 bacterium GW2011_GWF2_36_131]KKQ02642.1 MAG: Arginine-tRNA ligase [candidate division TM6 bacterium GW2011_GWE2_36_25]KKQ17997.1 MAG: Arginine-tRNA ligase [candidate division TM6 bacterium GW2011_GWA2_36_9]HBR70274.1 arginine--tRNA ligase [Candidatus Dependentiae bacterium]HCU00954.1 arginine--tRNA ligase [Candidatus Dependentiae bacterium]
MNIIDQIKNTLNTFLINTFNLSADDIISIDITLNTDEQRQQFGDLSTNAALILSKKIGKNPREIAEIIIKNFSHPLVKKTEIAGPGFINFLLTPEAFVELLKELTQQQENFFKPDHLKPKNFNIEFVSANPTGPLHFGHGRGGIIGDVLGNITKFVGYNTIKEFYINDAGSQIQKLGESFKARCYQELGENMPLPEDGYQGEYLVELAKEAVKEFDKQLLKKSDQFFAEYAKEKLLAKLQQTLKDYGINFDVWFSEKSLHENHKIEKAIERLKQAGFIYEQDGALWFKSTAFGDDKDRVLRKQDGSWTYVAADLAYMLDKAERGAQQMIMVLGQDHHGYVDRLHGLHKALGLQQSTLDIILYQLVSLKKDGQELRMSKRAGRMVTLQDIIDTVGKDVARFFYLNRKADAQLDFDINLALKKTEENPVYYLQYAFVRLNSILKNAAKYKELEQINENDAQYLTEEEHLMLKKIVALKDLLLNITKNYQTHQLTYYALELAQLFHSYYGKNKVIDLEYPERSRARLLLVQQLKMTLSLILKLLGISQPETM